MINVIYSFYQNTSDTDLKRIYLTLLERTFVPFINMIKLWTCSGVIDDAFDEFMIQMNQQYTEENLGEYYHELYWDKKFFQNKINVI